MDFINGNTKVLDAVYGILDKTLYPVVITRYKYYYLNIEFWGRGTLQYTEFDKETLEPLGSYELKFASYHTVRHVIVEPVPKIKLPEILVSQLPGLMPEEVDPEIILSYYAS